MPTYQHSCRACDLEWLEKYSYEVYDKMKAAGDIFPCPECESEDTFRCVGQTPVHFKGGGVGWADNGYYQYEAFDNHQKDGKNVELYERKEDLTRVMRGEKAEATKARLKREDELAKKYMGPNAAMSQQEADRRIKKATDGVKV